MDKRMTVAEARKAIQALGLTLRYLGGEYRVDFRYSHRQHDTAYYTNDLEDAVGTARLMAAEGRPTPNSQN